MFPKVSIPDASGSSPQTVTIQITTDEGADPGRETYLPVGNHFFVVSVHDSENFGDFAANATIAVGTYGTLIKALTAGTQLFCKTDSLGRLSIQVTDAVPETVYLVSRPYRGSKRLDCSDWGAVVIA